MEANPVVHNTFVLMRDYSRPPESVFRAFSDVATKRRWFAEGDHHLVEQFELDFRVGGAERLRYRLSPKTPFPNALIAAEGVCLDIVPDRRVVIASAMTFESRPISVTLVTATLTAIDSGTRLTCIHQGVFFDGADGPQIREAGWVKLLERLGTAV